MMYWLRDRRAHDVFVEPARAKPQIWRLVFGIVLVAAILLALNSMIFGAVLGVLEPETARSISDLDSLGQTAGSMLFLLCQIGMLGVAAAMVCVMVHSRRPATLIGSIPLATRQFVAVFVMMCLLVLVIWVLPPYDFSNQLERNMSVGRWMLLLPFALAAIFVQVSAEEVFFRGYLQQQLAARFRSPLVWVLLPAALFGLGHYAPSSAGSNATTIAIWAALFGVLMADLTARAGTLGPAIAVHFVNNITAMLISSPPDEMSGLALYVLPFGLADEAAMAQWLPVDFGWMIVSWLAARLAIRA